MYKSILKHNFTLSRVVIPNTVVTLMKNIDLFITLKETGYILFPAAATMMTSNPFAPFGELFLLFFSPAKRRHTE